ERFATVIFEEFIDKSPKCQLISGRHRKDNKKAKLGSLAFHQNHPALRHQAYKNKKTESLSTAVVKTSTI
ncbi:hypothetical protein, partial [Vibrio rotiferianus]|uniref:hypothetical protein n=1 Tax=Vibrio rotiferianus TaxID=190895 RepID=UPI0039193057